MERIDFVWTDGKNEEFQRFYLETEEYYSKIAGGLENRKGFVPYNLSESISDRDHELAAHQFARELYLVSDLGKVFEFEVVTLQVV